MAIRRMCEVTGSLERILSNFVPIHSRKPEVAQNYVWQLLFRLLDAFCTGRSNHDSMSVSFKKQPLAFAVHPHCLQ